MSRPKSIIIRFEDIPDGTKLVDAFACAIEELYLLENPAAKKNDPDFSENVQKYFLSVENRPVYAYYSWSKTAVIIPSEELYFKLRTARNRNLITENEQLCYRNTVIGVAGLSVGSGILNALVISGGPKKLKLADFDVIEITNLNRIKARLSDVGESKALVAARQVWDVDPFAEIEIYDEGLNRENLEGFLLKDRLDIFVDEMDDICLKFLARTTCRTNGIPVLMATDNGDTVILDVERFDLERGRSIFHGLVAEDLNLDSMDKQKWLKVSTQIIDPGYMTPGLQDSILRIGKELSGVPQLGTTANIAGAAVSFAVRRIANGYSMPSGRYVISLEEKLIPAYMDPESIGDRQKRTADFERKLFQGGGKAK